MAVRVTAADVKAILDNTSLTDPIIETYIVSANSMVNNNLLNSSLGADILKEIERWLAAHLISVTRERVAKKEGAGGAFIEYTGEYGLGLDSSPYGQMVKTLDSTGILSSLGAKKATMYTIPS